MPWPSHESLVNRDDFTRRAVGLRTRVEPQGHRMNLFSLWRCLRQTSRERCGKAGATTDDAGSGGTGRGPLSLLTLLPACTYFGFFILNFLDLLLSHSLYDTKSCP